MTRHDSVSSMPAIDSRLGFREELQRMKILVANLGSTSFKYRLFDLPSETQLARGGIDRIGQAQSACCVEIGNHCEEVALHVPDHAAAVRICLDQLMHPEWGCLKSVSEVSAIGFKAVFAGRLSGVRIVDEAHFRKFRWWPRSKRPSTRRFLKRTAAMPSHTNGRPTTRCAGGAFTAPATGT